MNFVSGFWIRAPHLSFPMVSSASHMEWAVISASKHWLLTGRLSWVFPNTGIGWSHVCTTKDQLLWGNKLLWPSVTSTIGWKAGFLCSLCFEYFYVLAWNKQVNFKIASKMNNLSPSRTLPSPPTPIHILLFHMSCAVIRQSILTLEGAGGKLFSGFSLAVWAKHTFPWSTLTLLNQHFLVARLFFSFFFFFPPLEYFLSSCAFQPHHPLH